MPRFPFASKSSNPAYRSLAAVNREPVDPVYRRLGLVLGWVGRRLTKQDWQHTERLPQQGGVIIVANHISKVDPIALNHCLIWSGRWARFLAKKDLWNVPFLGWLADRCGQIPVERNTSRAGNSLIHAEEALAAGSVVVIYPEATITADPDTWPMMARLGAARLALRTGAPVIPVGQWGANFLMPGKKVTWPRLFPKKTMHILFGEPVDLSDLAQGRAGETEANRRIMAAITALVSEVRGEPAPPERYDMRVGRRIPDPQGQADA